MTRLVFSLLLWRKTIQNLNLTSQATIKKTSKPKHRAPYGQPWEPILLGIPALTYQYLPASSSEHSQKLKAVTRREDYLKLPKDSEPAAHILCPWCHEPLQCQHCWLGAAELLLPLQGWAAATTVPGRIFGGKGTGGGNSKTCRTAVQATRP